MTFTFRKAVRENVSLLIGLAGGTGSGKTFSAMRLASGISGDKPFAVIDTEAGRAKHYGDQFSFDHGDLKPPFRPDAYADAIAAADTAGYGVIVVDSMSLEWSGDGGVLDWQEDEYQRLGGRDAIKLLSWSAPKQSHKRMVSKLLQVRAHLILCFRAEPHVEMVKEDGKTKIVPKVGLTGLKGWFPVTEKNLPYELTASFLLMAEEPGVPLPIKLQNQHKTLFPLDKPITEESGRLIAAWAAGGTGEGSSQAERQRPLKPSSDGSNPSSPTSYITASQAADLRTLCQDHGIPVTSLCKAAGVVQVEQILAEHKARAYDWIKVAVERRKAE